MATPQNAYNSGSDATIGAQTKLHNYDRKGIESATTRNIYGQWADKKSQPTETGKTFKISKILNLYDRALNDSEFASKGYLTARSVASVSADLDSNVLLAEGSGATNKRAIQKVTMETTFARYGEMIDYTDEVALFSEDRLQVEYREALGDLSNLRMEDLVQRDMLATGTVAYSGVATSMQSVDSIVTYETIKRASRKLVRNRAKKNTKIVSGSIKVDTHTVATAYYAIVGADVKGDLEGLTRSAGTTTDHVFRPTEQYIDADKTVLQGEVGQIHETRFIESETALTYAGMGAPLSITATSGVYTDDVSIKTSTYNDAAAVLAIRGSVAGENANVMAEYANGAAVTAAGATAVLEYVDVFPILYPTEGAFATVGLRGRGKIKFIARSPSEAISNDNAFGMQGFYSYNFFYAGIILEEEKLLKVLTAASA